MPPTRCRMFDGVKIPIKGRDQQRLRSHHLLTWKPNGVDALGRERFVARWGAFTFKGDADRCTSMRGSFHCHHHGGENWQDFTREHFAEAVAAVCITLGLHPTNMRLANVEVGVNIGPPMPTPDVLRYIVLHRTQGPQPMRVGVGVVIQHTAYRFKIYDKARQYGRPGELLRFEVAVRKMRAIARYGLRTLADLLQPQAWTAMRGYLLDRFDELLIVEPDIITDGLKPSERDLLTRAKDPGYWIDLGRRERSEKRRTLSAIYARSTSPGLKATLRALIATKTEELGAVQFVEVAARTISPTGEGIATASPEGPERTFSPHALRGANVRGEGIGEEVRRCSVCGRDITHQDPRSQVCSERLYGKEGKRCRNTLSNRTLSLRRMDVRSALLFDQQPFIRPPQHGNTSPRP